jgi:hypothetical protein
MKLETMDENTVRHYLLGDASSSDQQEVEFWLMSDVEGYDLLVAAEDDLIDDFLCERLSARDFELFNSHFLATDERRRKLAFSRFLLQHVR